MSLFTELEYKYLYNCELHRTETEMDLTVINNYVCGSLSLCGLNRTHFWNFCPNFFSHFGYQNGFSFHKLPNIRFSEYFLQLSHNLRTINDKVNITGEKSRKLDTLTKLFQTNRPVSWHDHRTT